MINAYGNVKLLLQNKISNLDRLENLEKVKGDEKLGNVFKVINMMTELSNLAIKHNLQYKLYVGGGGGFIEVKNKPLLRGWKRDRRY